MSVLHPTQDSGVIGVSELTQARHVRICHNMLRGGMTRVVDTTILENNAIKLYSFSFR